MKKRTIWITAAGAAAAIALGGTAIAASATNGFERDDDGPGESEQVLTGPDLERASQAALDEAGPGEVLEAEVGDDGESAYEVEIRLDSGASVEVMLDADFNPIGTETEDDGSGGDDDPAGQDD
ncbi:PepSY domain-containing protein [Agromyces sp. NPDC056523]|uniref:PepSY domain-containing protein n=1 Tax=Agromyces sp. NPDC056523 TaxID=3345850 RepID=UPI00366E3DFB